MKGSVREHREWLAAERSGHAFIAWDDPTGAQCLVILDASMARVPIGRSTSTAISVRGDSQVSRTHALLERVGVDWVLSDEGLSRNGTWVNGERLRRRRRLVDGDRLRVGQTMLVFVDRRPVPGEDESSTGAGSVVSRLDMLSPVQRSVLDALCAPMRASRFAAPATNAEIAEALHLSVDSVKGHMRMLFRVFGIADVPQNKKRAQLAEIGMRSGLGSP